MVGVMSEIKFLAHFIHFEATVTKCDLFFTIYVKVHAAIKIISFPSFMPEKQNVDLNFNDRAGIGYESYV